MHLHDRAGTLAIVIYKYVILSNQQIGLIARNLLKSNQLLTKDQSLLLSPCAVPHTYEPVKEDYYVYDSVKH